VPVALDDLRAALTAVDDQLVELMAERQQLVEQISARKLKSGTATRDYQREKEVLSNAGRKARELGLPPAVAEEIMGLLIQTSLTKQEKARVAAEGAGGGKRALVIGGAGKMGRWFAEFLASQGYRITIADPDASGDVPFPQISDFRTGELDEDIIVVAAPLSITAEILTELAERKPRGLIVDVGSLKSPLRQSLLDLVAAGCQVASIHPMFGPNTHLLSGRHVIFVDLGQTEALAAAQALFASTMADQFVMNLDEHDRLIAYVLGLSHALNIAFFTALADSGELVPRLAQMSSTTFDAQLEVAGLVAQDNPRLYFEIQALNEYGEEALDALIKASHRIRDSVRDGNEAEFVTLMEAGREYLARRA
jgi:chorismate mutase/prephenate dehydrogenase